MACGFRFYADHATGVLSTSNLELVVVDGLPTMNLVGEL